MSLKVLHFLLTSMVTQTHILLSLFARKEPDRCLSRTVDSHIIWEEKIEQAAHVSLIKGYMYH